MSLGLRENEKSLFSYDYLFRNKTTVPNLDLDIRLLNIEDYQNPENIIYNGGLFTLDNNLYLIARIEKLDDENSKAKRYIYKDNKFIPDPSCFDQDHSQDPSPFYHPEFGVVHSLIKTVSDKNDPRRISKYRSIIHPNNKKTILAKGPWGQKGLKFFYKDNEYIIIARNREEKDVNGFYQVCAATHLIKVPELKTVTPKFIKEILKNPNTIIKNFFAKNEWGNVADCMLELEDGNIAVMGHVAKYADTKIKERDPDKYYSIFVGTLNPDTLETSNVKMILTAQDIISINPNLPPKRSDLNQVVYPRSMGFCKISSKVYLIGSCGVGDRYSAVFKILWPFNVLPKVNSLSNSIFNYPVKYINELFFI